MTSQLPGPTDQRKVRVLESAVTRAVEAAGADGSLDPVGSCRRPSAVGLRPTSPSPESLLLPIPPELLTRVVPGISVYWAPFGVSWFRGLRLESGGDER